MLISRYAPTPSGYLHIGNIYNFLMTLAHVKRHQGQIWLRIDDGDQTRVRDEYLEDIFSVLSWLDLTYDEGPTSIKDLNQNFSQRFLFEKIKNDLAEMPFELFSCHCSRKEINQNSPTGIYPGTCYQKTELLFSDQYNIRLKTNVITDHYYISDKMDYKLGNENHDLILWKKDQSPSYQILSLYHDQLIGTNCIIRGVDLLESTAIQMMLSEKLGHQFHLAYIYHHDLLTEKDGTKISKSTNKADTKSLMDQYQSPQQFFEDLSERLKLKIKSTKEFLEKQPALQKRNLKVSIH